MTSDYWALPLYIEPDKTIGEAQEMLRKLFDGKNMVSILDHYDFADGGLIFTIQYKAKDDKHLKKVIEDAGIKIDEEALYDMMD